MTKKQPLLIRETFTAIVCVGWDQRKGTWVVRGAQDFDFTKAKSSCKRCHGSGWWGWADCTLNRESDNTPFAARIPIVCPKCFYKMRVYTPPKNEPAVTLPPPGLFRRIRLFLFRLFVRKHSA